MEIPFDNLRDSIKFLLPLIQFRILTVALQDNQIAADIRSGVVGKEVVRQTDSRNDIAGAHQIFTYRLVLL